MKKTKNENPRKTHARRIFCIFYLFISQHSILGKVYSKKRKKFIHEILLLYGMRKFLPLLIFKYPNEHFFVAYKQNIQEKKSLRGGIEGQFRVEMQMIGHGKYGKRLL